MVDNNKPRVVADKLIDQLEGIEGLFAFGAKLYPYEQARGAEPEINEDMRRRQIAKGTNFGPLSAHAYGDSILWGFGATYLFSRVGAKTIFDMGPVRKNIWASGAIFMLGTTLGALVQASMYST